MGLKLRLSCRIYLCLYIMDELTIVKFMFTLNDAFENFMIIAVSSYSRQQENSVRILCC